MKENADNSFRRIALEAIVIAALGVLLGLSFHYRHVLEALEPKEAISPALYPAPVGLAEMQDLLDQGGVAVDARSREAFQEERIYGAVSLALGEAREALPGFMRRFPPETVLVVYCGGHGCPDSFDLAVRLLSAGYRDVRVFEGGLPAWRDAGLPVKEEE
jgi:rhodanese-related sulfurtransferase